MQQGAAALRALGISEESVGTLGVSSLAHVSYDKHGEVLGSYGANLVESQPTEMHHQQKKNFHIPRQKLRHLLLQNVEKASISWGSKLVEINKIHSNECGKEESLELLLADGSTHRVSCVVGSDGIFSSVRNLCFPAAENNDDDRLNFLGLFVILGISKHTPFSGIELGVRQQQQWLDGNARVFAMPFGDNEHTMWQLSFPQNLEAASSLLREPLALKAMAIRMVRFLRITNRNFAI